MFSRHLHVISFTADQRKCAGYQRLQNCVRFRFERRSSYLFMPAYSFVYSAATVLHFQRCSRSIALFSFLFNIIMIKSCCLFGCRQCVAVACRTFSRTQPVSSSAVSPSSAFESFTHHRACCPTKSFLLRYAPERDNFLRLQIALLRQISSAATRAAQPSPR